MRTNLSERILTNNTSKFLQAECPFLCLAQSLKAIQRRDSFSVLEISPHLLETWPILTFSEKIISLYNAYVM